MYNEMRVGGEDEHFEVVFFPNGDDPTVTPVGLPSYRILQAPTPVYSIFYLL